MAVCEGTVLLGAVLMYVSGNMNDLYMFGVPGVLGMLLNFPQNEE